jgi:4'-phosphopantetheinyl transferase EntD
VGVGVDSRDDRALDFAARRVARRRRATRAALAQLGLALDVPGVGASGEPVWSAGVVGSISHSETSTVAVVARAADCGGLGVDIERDVPVSSPFAGRICSERELTSLAEGGKNPEDWALVVFSAKEAVYKLQFPYSKEIVGLRRVEVELQQNGSFVATFREALAPFPRGFQLRGRFRRRHGFIVTSASLTDNASLTDWRFASEKAANHWQRILA